MRRGWYLPVGVLALLSGPVLAASTAAAAAAAPVPGARPATAQPGGPQVQPGGLARPPGVRNAASVNWSGYAVHGGTYKSVSASWTEPTGHCTASGHSRAASFWVGLDGYSLSDRSVEQTGTDTDCNGATPKYYAWYEMYPAGSHLISHPVRPGDKLSASVVAGGGGRFTLTLADHTRGWTATEHRTLSSAKRASAEVIIEAPSSVGILPLADFGTVHFTGSTVDGSSIGSRHPTKITMVGSHNVHLDKISGLSNGTAFSGTWLHG